MRRKTMPPRLDNYNRVLEVAGDITANTIFPNSEAVDAESPHCENGRVRYAAKTHENLEATRKAGLVNLKAPCVKLGRRRE